MYTKMDYKILKAITDKNDMDKGLSMMNGTTYNEIKEKTGASISKIQKSINVFIKNGLVENGLGNGRVKTFILTHKGISEIKKFKKNIALEDDE